MLADRFTSPYRARLTRIAPMPAYGRTARLDLWRMLCLKPPQPREAVMWKKFCDLRIGDTIELATGSMPKFSHAQGRQWLGDFWALKLGRTAETSLGPHNVRTPKCS